MGKRKFALTMPRAMALSALLHAVGIALFSSHSPERSGALKVGLVRMEGQDGNPASEGDDLAKINSDLEGYVEYSSREFYTKSDVPEAYMAREHQYHRMLSEDIFAGLEYLDVPIPGKPAEETSKVKFYEEGIDVEQVRHGYAGPSLHMTGREMQSLLDRIMPRPKEEQLRHVFGYVNMYNNNEGDLPRLVRELYRQNMIRVVYPASSKINAINRMEEMLNKPQLFKYAYDYLEKSPESKVAVEMLFMLESTYQLTLESAEEILYANEDSRDGGKDIQAEVISRVRASLEERMGGRGGMGLLTERITAKRIELLKRVVEIGSYRRNDALLLLAGIYTGLDSEEEAMKCLKMINPKETDFVYRKYYAELEEDVKNGDVGSFVIHYTTRKILQDGLMMLEERGERFLWGK